MKLDASALAHKTLIEVLQRLFDDYGVMVHDVRATWLDINKIDGHIALCQSVRLDTTFRTDSERGVKHETR